MLALYNRYARSAFALLACLCAVSVFLYGAFLLLAVAHTASRARAGAAIVELKGKLSSVENRYLAATQELTPTYAAQLGFVRPASVSVVYATEPGNPLTINTSLPSQAGLGTR
jgi:hypothetical protein